MKKKSAGIGILITLLLLPVSSIHAQMDELHGDYDARAKNIHSGNRIRTTFYNDGMWGRRTDSDYGLDWPKNNIETARYMAGTSQIVVTEVIDLEGQKIHIASETDVGISSPSQGDRSPTGEWWTFLPMPGFHNPRESLIAMSDDPDTWPGFWPDKWTAADKGWQGSWNGYFGKNKLNADQESYFVYDDYNNAEFNFFPDSTDLNRRGVGIRVTTRGFQWSNVLVQDILFCLYDIKNVGTHQHDRVVFGNKSGFFIGSTARDQGDQTDDLGKYILEEDLAICYDLDNRGSGGGWSPVGQCGVAYLESPGYPFDGIDNDGDGANGPGDIITQETFAPKIVHPGDPLVFIDYTTFERTVANAFQDHLSNPYFFMDSDSIKLVYLKQEFKFVPGDTLREIEIDNFDNNLNGIIDENNGSVFGRDPNNQIHRFLYIGHKYVNYMTGNGLDNSMIDERRDDGIDNNGNWTIIDDVGLDGNIVTLDQGQGDGRPTSGWQDGFDTELPGEPHIDKTDINESDMIGLTAFEILKPYSSLPSWDDELLWEHLKPGYLDDEVLLGDNTDLAFGSGFFVMAPGQIERYSMSYQMAFTEENLIRVKNWGSRAYAENYQFASAPETPIVNAVAGNGKVTLYWDSAAEYSVDPLTGRDFEGYRIYRSTDALWQDMEAITDAYGNPVYRVPVAQFDLDNDYSGYFPIEDRGIMYPLGENTGITHSFADTTVTNGIRYYYAVVSYDHGSQSYGVPPTESPAILNISQIGDVEEKGVNVVVVTPGVNVLGMPDSPEGSFPIERVSGVTDGIAYYNIAVGRDMKGEHSYRITFRDTAYVDTMGSGTTIVETYSFDMFDLTGNSYVTRRDPNVRVPMVLDGLQIMFEGPQILKYDELNSKWSRSNIVPFYFDLYRDENNNIIGDPLVGDFTVDFGAVGLDTSENYITETGLDCPAQPVNFTITNTASQKKVPFAFYERDTRKLDEGAFSFYFATRSDEIIFLKPGASETGYRSSWHLKFLPDGNAPADSVLPQPGDFLSFFFSKPFTRSDTLMFTTPAAPEFDESVIADALEDIQVVPNPYVVTNEFEPTNYYVQGRGDRHLHFVNLPPQCTIRIYTLSGHHVDTIVHNVGNLDRGEAIWDMTTKEEMDIGFGVYIYHVDAGKYGEKIGKFAVIK
jgi:hypothetical protein